MIQGHLEIQGRYVIHERLEAGLECADPLATHSAQAGLPEGVTWPHLSLTHWTRSAAPSLGLDIPDLYLVDQSSELLGSLMR